MGLFLSKNPKTHEFTRYGSHDKGEPLIKY